MCFVKKKKKSVILRSKIWYNGDKLAQAKAPLFAESGGIVNEGS